MSMKDFGTVKNIEDTPFGYTLSVISGKWKMVILYWLAEYSALRFNTLHRLIKTVSYKTLSIQLKELEKTELFCGWNIRRYRRKWNTV